MVWKQTTGNSDQQGTINNKESVETLSNSQSLYPKFPKR